MWMYLCVFARYGQWKNLAKTREDLDLDTEGKKNPEELLDGG